MKPYFQTDDGAIRIFHARWEDVLAAGVFTPNDIALVHADPPYGVNERTERKKAGRGELCECRDFPRVAGDDKPFDPGPLLELGRPLVLWGANHYADRVHGSNGWLLWDKRNGTTPDDNADGELAWTNLGGPLRIFRHLWRGTCRASETGTVHLHPTQKPEALSAWVFTHAEQRKKLKRGDTILVPYMGSGPDLRPALAAGYNVIACEVAREYCDTAISARLNAITEDTAKVAVGPLFAR